MTESINEICLDVFKESRTKHQLIGSYSVQLQLIDVLFFLFNFGHVLLAGQPVLSEETFHKDFSF